MLKTDRQQSWSGVLPESEIHNGIKLTEEDWQQLRKSMDQAYPNLTFRICMLYPKITPHQLRICYLVKLKFTNDNIADLLYSTPASVSIARKRLYEKITGKNVSKLYKDAFIGDVQQKGTLYEFFIFSISLKIDSFIILSNANSCVI